jgi:hypothetical protein
MRLVIHVTLTGQAGLRRMMQQPRSDRPVIPSERSESRDLHLKVLPV